MASKLGAACHLPCKADCAVVSRRCKRASTVMERQAGRNTMSSGDKPNKGKYAQHAQSDGKRRCKRRRCGTWVPDVTHLGCPALT